MGTKTAGLTVKAKRDTRKHPLGVKGHDVKMDALLLTRADFHAGLPNSDIDHE